MNFGITKLSDGSEGTLKLVVKRSLSTCQPRSQCFSLPVYFLQSFWVQYFASNHMSSQTIYPRLLPWHYNDRQYQNNIVHCKSYILRKDRSVSSYERVRTSEPKGLVWYDFLMTPQLEKNCLERCTYHRQPSVPSRRV